MKTLSALAALILLAGCSPAATPEPSVSAPSIEPSATAMGTPRPTRVSTSSDGCADKGLSGRIAFTVGDGNANGIGVVEADGSDFHIVVEAKVIAGQPGGGTEAPRWIGPGRLIFDSNRNGGPDDFHLFTVDENGDGPVQLTKGPEGIENYGSLSRDGSFMAFAKYLATGDPKEPFGGGGIFIADPDGRHERQVTKTPKGGFDDWPDISPDGKEIAFTRQELGDDGGLFVVNVDGTGLKRLIPADFEPERARWSGDGRMIVFHNNRHRHLSQSANVWVIDADGSDLRQLTFEETDGQAFYPTWSPDDRQILFVHKPRGVARNDLAVVSSAGGAICTLWAGTRAAGAWESDWQAAATPAIVGSWSRVNRCEDALAAFKKAGLDDQIQTWVINNFVAEGAVRAPGHECDGAIPPDSHSHFFTADGGFGSRDAAGNQVDEGDWVLVDDDTLSFPTHASELGDGTDVIVDFHVAGETITFEVSVPPTCQGRCRLAYGWALSAFFGPTQWSKTRA